MTKTKPITKSVVLDTIRDIITEMPDRVNPVDRYVGACMYHQGRGRNLKRCLVGEVGYRLNLPTPDPHAGSVLDLTASPLHDDDAKNATGVWHGRFTDAAAAVLLQAQAFADADNESEWDDELGRSIPAPARWGDLKISRLA